MPSSIHSPGRLERTGRFVARHARPVALAWLLAAVLGYGAAAGGLFTGESLFKRLTSGEPSLPGESQDGRDLLSENAASGGRLLLLIEDVRPDDPRLATAIADLQRDLAQAPGVAMVTGPASAPPGTLVSADEDSVLVTVDLDQGLTRAAEREVVAQASDRLGAVAEQVPGATGQVGGVPLLVDEITGQVEKDLRTGEAIALPFSLLALVLIFGGLVAGGIPIVGALVAIAGGLASLLGFSYLSDVDAAIVNVVTVLGLGLSIDYALLVVSRFREELRRAGQLTGAVPDTATMVETVGRTMATAGRTVLFSGITVAISVAGLMLFRVDLIRATGVAAMAVVTVALMVALTLVPALLMLGRRWVTGRGVLARVPLLRRAVARFGDIAPEHGFFSRLSAAVQRRPVWVMTLTALLLVVLALPAIRLELRNSGAELLPPGAAQRELFLQVQQDFPAVAFAPVVIVADAGLGELSGYASDVARLDGVDRVGVPRQQDKVAVLDVWPHGPAQGETARAVVAELRGHPPDFPTWVTGQAAGIVDFQEEIARAAPWAVLVVVLATFVLLFLLTGSVLIPVKALIMNVLSLGATFGVLVWVFQDGRFEDLLGFGSPGGIESTVPILVLAFAFGLAMDYEVFLLSRIKEVHDARSDNDAAVRLGLQRTGRIITSAALIICIVFVGFVAGRLLIIKETGVALALAVMIDATLVRCLLVPATMTVLGEWNWWSPPWLHRLHARLGLREAPSAVRR